MLSTLLVFVLGRDFFPKVDAGQIRLHFRARTGLRIEETARLADQIDGVIRQTIPQGELETMLDNIGVPYSGINLSYSNAGTFGTADGEILVQLKHDRKKPTGEYIDELRSKLPQTFPGAQFFFQPADIVTQILNFGTPAPIDVQFTGANQQGNYVVARKSCQAAAAHPGAADVHVQQAFDQPTLYMDIDRTRVQNRGTAGQGCGAEPAGVVELQLSDRAGVLAGSRKWRELQRRGANAAISCGHVTRRCKIRQ